MEATEKMAAEDNKEEALLALLRRAELGDVAVLTRLRQVLDANPHIWQRAGDLAATARESIIRLTAGPNMLLGESLVRKINSLTAELAGEEPSPLVQLLAERVGICWLWCGYLDALAAQTANDASKLKLINQERAGAQKQQLAATKMLAEIRRLLRPPARKLAASTEPSRLRDIAPPWVSGMPVLN
jgi:hypothetical protein